jgi:hypothetical protein
LTEALRFRTFIKIPSRLQANKPACLLVKNPLASGRFQAQKSVCSTNFDFDFKFFRRVESLQTELQNFTSFVCLLLSTT